MGLRLMPIVALSLRMSVWDRYGLQIAMEKSLHASRPVPIDIQRISPSAALMDRLFLLPNQALQRFLKPTYMYAARRCIRICEMSCKIGRASCRERVCQYV